MVPVALAFHLSAVEDMVHQFNLDLILICPLVSGCYTYVNSLVCWNYIVSAW